MKLRFAARMEQFQTGIFNVLDEKKKELEHRIFCRSPMW